jgi:hypothetical protein
MECVREIQDGRLRLRVRAYGAIDSNSGTQFAGSGVNLTAASVTNIAVQVVVRNSSPKDCATNSGVGHSLGTLESGTATPKHMLIILSDRS